MAERTTVWLADIDWDDKPEVASFEVIATEKMVRLPPSDDGHRQHFGRIGGFVGQLERRRVFETRDAALTALAERLQRTREAQEASLNSTIDNIARVKELLEEK